MASFSFSSTPPSSSFVFSPSNGDQSKLKPLENPLLAKSPLGPTTTAPRPASTSVLTVDTVGHTGLRQRRKPNGIEPPPKASFSLGMGFDASVAEEDKNYWNGESPSAATSLTSASSSLTTPTAEPSMLLPSTTGCWVCVYGYATEAQYQEILRRFSAYGQVINHRGSCQPTRSNWIAIQYATRLQAVKALCHRDVQLSDGIFCGVFALADNDPKVLLPSGQAGLWGTENGVDKGVVTSNGGPPVDVTLDEKDILLAKDSPRARQRTSLCKRLLLWLLSIEEE